jgi:PBP1b-binding outer membrane lipoprotein LpoB
MKNTVIILLITFIFFSCSNVLDKPINHEHWPEVQEKIETMNEFSENKKDFIIENISEQIGFMALGIALREKANMETTSEDLKKLGTFAEAIEKLSTEYDSAIIINKKLNDFLILNDCSGISVDKYDGYIGFDISFNNQFDKDILYIVFNYNYIDKYDVEHIDENVRLTDKVAGNFKDDVEISTETNYSISKFFHSNLPTNSEKASEFLMKHMKLKTLKIVFTDKTEINYNDEIKI